MMRRLVIRSLFVLALLFGLLYAVGIALLHRLNLPLSWALGFSATIVALQYLLGPYFIQWFFSIHWVEARDISPELDVFLRDLCRSRGLRVPRMGLIEDGNPNAFTFGHLPSNARVVVTRGLVDALTPEELHAVVGHEMGHVAHYDFLVMALASVVPLFLYNIYQWTRRERNQATWVIALGAYAAYLLSQFGVLLLSRIREFFADEHAVESVQDANAISRALVKIAYGMARLPREYPRGKEAKKDPSQRPGRVAMAGALGIGDMKAGGALALATTEGDGNFSLERMGQAMRWDLWNPWARWYELFSTHPLVARRVAAASRLALERGQAPMVAPLGAPPQDLWPAFFRELAIKLLPWIGIVAGLFLGNPHFRLGSVKGPFDLLFSGELHLGLMLLLAGMGLAVRMAYSYGGGFESAAVAGLLAQWGVSQVKGIPGELRGTIVGRGVPGLFWSKDLILQDDTGFITLVYRQPLAFLETLFGWRKAADLIGCEVTARGWYRRGPGPSFEVDDLLFGDGTRVGCYYRHGMWVLAAVLTLVGAALLVF
ncbi:MAG TPA: M48 family metalloprotease [Holophagaceae bacterium]|nr:M48 family metalloprotease [Holophagaceae bacterium]